MFLVVLCCIVFSYGQTRVFASQINISFSLRNGDVNGDNIVEDQDYSIMGKAWYTLVGDPNYDARADLNGDGAVEDQDYSILGLNWYQSGDAF